MIVIADDITGAAEIAGLAFSKGQQVKLVCSSTPADGLVCCNGGAAHETIVIATDTRSMTEAEAVEETRRIGEGLKDSRIEGLKNSKIEELKDGRIEGLKDSIFKKTDSALRGHVVAELTVLMQATGYQRAVYLPANPSKGRVIRDGIYYIKDVPIHQTAFSYDPEFPALTSNLHERFPDAEAHHIIMPDAENEADIRRIVAQYDDGKTLFAGAADLYNSLTPLSKRRGGEGEAGEASLILCGSTQSHLPDISMPVAPMPLELYDGSSDISLWKTDAYANEHSLILTIPFTHRTGKEVAVHLRSMMAQKAKELVAQLCPDHLIIEGGATAWATLEALGWHHFTIVSQLAPGVVQMRADCGTLVTLKPGSYPWPKIMHN